MENSFVKENSHFFRFYLDESFSHFIWMNLLLALFTAISFIFVININHSNESIFFFEEGKFFFSEARRIIEFESFKCFNNEIVGEKKNSRMNSI